MVASGHGFDRAASTSVPHAPRAMTMASRVSGVLALLFCIGLTISLLMRKFAPPG